MSKRNTLVEHFCCLERLSGVKGTLIALQTHLEMGLRRVPVTGQEEKVLSFARGGSELIFGSFFMEGVLSTGTNFPGQWWGLCPWKCSKSLRMWHLRTWLSEWWMDWWFTVDFHDLKGLFQPCQLCDSMILLLWSWFVQTFSIFPPFQPLLPSPLKEHEWKPKFLSHWESAAGGLAWLGREEVVGEGAGCWQKIPTECKPIEQTAPAPPHPLPSSVPVPTLSRPSFSSLLVSVNGSAAPK